MKKQLLLSILGMAAVSAFGQGFITLDNYFSYGPIITYGFYWPANGVSGAQGIPGAGLNSSWTAGLYYAMGNLSISDPTGTGIPAAPLSLATGTGSTAQFASAFTFNTPGEFLSPNWFNTGAPVGSTITAEVVAYDTAGGSYANAAYRVHSIPFTMPTVSITAPEPSIVGAAMIAAGITQVEAPNPNWPEPSTFALTSLGLLSLLAFRRRIVTNAQKDLAQAASASDRCD